MPTGAIQTQMLQPTRGHKHAHMNEHRHRNTRQIILHAHAHAHTYNDAQPRSMGSRWSGGQGPRRPPQASPLPAQPRRWEGQPSAPSPGRPVPRQRSDKGRGSAENKRNRIRGKQPNKTRDLLGTHGSLAPQDDTWRIRQPCGGGGGRPRGCCTGGDGGVVSKCVTEPIAKEHAEIQLRRATVSTQKGSPFSP